MSALDANTGMPEPEIAGLGAPACELPAGHMVGQYRIERLIGRGGMGVVYAARQPEIGARVAIKVLDAQRASDARLVQRFLDEARAVNRIRHPNIIDVFAFGRLEDDRHYFVMEYLEGETLGARLERGLLYPSEAGRLLLQICQALEAAHHEGIVHRDLKPENLWIATPRHGTPYVKILDFGIAKLVEPGSSSMATEEGVVMGTPHFMSPEQCRGEPVDHRTDVYALGVLLYRIFSERLPFDGASSLAVLGQQITASPLPPSSHRALPAALEQLILRCLSKDPAGRPQSAGALGVELSRILADEASLDTLPSGADLRGKGRTAGLQGRSAEAPAEGRERRGRRGIVVTVVVGLLAVAAAISGLRAYRSATGSAHPAATRDDGRNSGVPDPGSSRDPAKTDPLVAPPVSVAPEKAARPAPSAHPREQRAIAPSGAGRRELRRRKEAAPFLEENPFR